MYTTTTLGSVEFIERITPQELVREDVGFQPLLERDVIVRQLTPEAAADARTRAQFIKQARTLAALRHHNLVQVYEAGLNDDLPYVVLEKLSGITVQQRLDQLVDENRRIDIEEAVNIVQAIATAVEHVHQSGALVYDVSPSNIVLSKDGRIMLASLGQELSDNLLALSKTELAYAAPERLLGGVVDGRSDVYALGVLLYHLIFGKLPFEGTAAGIIAKKQESASLPALDNPGTELPCSYALAYLLRQATSRALDNRYATVAAFRSALSNVLTSGPVKVQFQRRPSYATYHAMQLQRQKRTAAQTPASPALTDEQSPQMRLAREWNRATLAAAPATPVSAPVVVDAASVDPLMPGLDNPHLQPALRFTTLVPLPEGADAEPLPEQPTAARNPMHYLWLVGLFVMTVASVGAAITLG